MEIYPILMMIFAVLMALFCGLKAVELAKMPGGLARFLRAYYLVFCVLWGLMSISWAWQVWR